MALNRDCVSPVVIERGYLVTLPSMHNLAPQNGEMRSRAIISNHTIDNSHGVLKVKICKSTIITIDIIRKGWKDDE